MRRGEGGHLESFDHAYAAHDIEELLDRRNEYGEPVESGEARPRWPGRRTEVQLYARAAAARPSPEHVQRAATLGVADASERLPYLERIQASFGPAHDLSDVRARIGGAARDAADEIGAHAYTTGDRIAFGETPTLRLAAHEAAHVVQQRGGVSLSSGVGSRGDAYEELADRVAERVVRGESAADLLGPVASGASAGRAVQREEKPNESPQNPAANPRPPERVDVWFECWLLTECHAASVIVDKGRVIGRYHETHKDPWAWKDNGRSYSEQKEIGLAWNEGIHLWEARMHERANGAFDVKLWNGGLLGKFRRREDAQAAAVDGSVWIKGVTDEENQQAITTTQAVEGLLSYGWVDYRIKDWEAEKALTALAALDDATRTAALAWLPRAFKLRLFSELPVKAYPSEDFGKVVRAIEPSELKSLLKRLLSRHGLLDWAVCDWEAQAVLHALHALEANERKTLIQRLPAKYKDRLLQESPVSEQTQARFQSAAHEILPTQHATAEDEFEIQKQPGYDYAQLELALVNNVLRLGTTRGLFSPVDFRPAECASKFSTLSVAMSRLVLARAGTNRSQEPEIASEALRTLGRIQEDLAKLDQDLEAHVRLHTPPGLARYQPDSRATILMRLFQQRRADLVKCGKSAHVLASALPDPAQAPKAYRALVFRLDDLLSDLQVLNFEQGTPSIESRAQLLDDAVSHEGAIRVSAVFFPSEQLLADETDERAKAVREMPLVVYAWPDGKGWYLRDITDPKRAKRQWCAAEPTHADFRELFENASRCPHGYVLYEVALPSGNKLANTVPTSGSMKWYEWLGLAGGALGLLALLGVPFVGVPCLIIGAVAAGASLVDQAQHGFETTQAILDVLQLVSCVTAGALLAFKITKDLSTSLGQAKSAAGRDLGKALGSVAKLEGRYALPLAKIGFVSDVAQFITFTPECFKQLEAVVASDAPLTKKIETLVLVFGQWLLMGYATVVHVKFPKGATTGDAPVKTSAAEASVPPPDGQAETIRGFWTNSCKGSLDKWTLDEMLAWTLGHDNLPQAGKLLTEPAKDALATIAVEGGPLVSSQARARIVELVGESRIASIRAARQRASQDTQGETRPWTGQDEPAGVKTIEIDGGKHASAVEAEVEGLVQKLRAKALEVERAAAAKNRRLRVEIVPQRVQNRGEPKFEPELVSLPDGTEKLVCHVRLRWIEEAQVYLRKTLYEEVFHCDAALDVLNADPWATGKVLAKQDGVRLFNEARDKLKVAKKLLEEGKYTHADLEALRAEMKLYVNELAAWKGEGFGADAVGEFGAEWRKLFNLDIDKELAKAPRSFAAKGTPRDIEQYMLHGENPFSGMLDDLAKHEQAFVAARSENPDSTKTSLAWSDLYDSYRKLLRGLETVGPSYLDESELVPLVQRISRQLDADDLSAVKPIADDLRAKLPTRSAAAGDGDLEPSKAKDAIPVAELKGLAPKAAVAKLQALGIPCEVVSDDSGRQFVRIAPPDAVKMGMPVGEMDALVKGQHRLVRIAANLRRRFGVDLCLSDDPLFRGLYQSSTKRLILDYEGAGNPGRVGPLQHETMHLRSDTATSFFDHRLVGKSMLMQTKAGMYEGFAIDEVPAYVATARAYLPKARSAIESGASASGLVHLKDALLSIRRGRDFLRAIHEALVEAKGALAAGKVREVVTAADKNYDVGPFSVKPEDLARFAIYKPIKQRVLAESPELAKDPDALAARIREAAPSIEDAQAQIDLLVLGGAFDDPAKRLAWLKEYFAEVESRLPTLAGQLDEMESSLDAIKRLLAAKHPELATKLDAYDLELLDALANQKATGSALAPGESAMWKQPTEELRSLALDALFKSSTVKPGARDEALARIDRLLGELDPGHTPKLSIEGWGDPKVRARIEALLGKDPVALAQLRKLHYLRHGGYEPVDGAPAPSDQVRIYGYDSDVSETAIQPGHIMGTIEGDPAGTHVSYAPIDRDGSPQQPFESYSEKAVKQPPYPGATNRLSPSAKPSKYLAPESDPYRLKVPYGKPLDFHFDHAFHKDFLDPDAFQNVVFRVTEASKRRQELYVLFSSELKPGQQGIKLERYPAYEVPYAEIDGKTTVQAKNCVTEMIHVLSQLKTRSTSELIFTKEDLAMLGINEDGTYNPGRDLRTQDIYEHLRWKEHEFLRKQGLLPPSSLGQGK